MRLLQVARAGQWLAADRLIQQHGADVHVRDNDFRSPLHYAAQADWRSPAPNDVVQTIGTLLLRGARHSGASPSPAAAVGRVGRQTATGRAARTHARHAKSTLSVVR
jgi:hypothetical protein